MLSFIESPRLYLPFRQHLFDGKEAQELLLRRVNRICIARSPDDCQELLVYDLLQTRTISEVGITYGPGPEHRCKQAFPAEVLSILTYSRDIYLAHTFEHFEKLIKKLNLNFF